MRVLLAGLTLCLMGAQGRPGWATEQLLFGPWQVTRTGGVLPTQAQATVETPPTLTGPFRLHVQNGDGAGHHRIVSGTITVNGAVVAGPLDFYSLELPIEIHPAPVIDRQVSLQSRNTLQIRFLGLPGSYLILWVYGTVPPPTLRALEPPVLPITTGGTGTLMVKISASQSTDTVISLQSSHPMIAAVPATVTVPSGSVTVPIPVAATSQGTATITAALNGSTLSAAVTVSPSGPTPTSLLPSMLQVTQGATGALTLTLSATQAVDTVVPLRTSNSAVVGLPPTASVTIPAGQASQAFAVFGVSPGQAAITASLNGTAAQSQVNVVIPLPTVVSLKPPSLPLTEGSSGSLTLTLNASQSTDTEVFLTTSDRGIVGLPGEGVIVPANTLSTSFFVTGLAPGMATVTTSLNGSDVTSAITVSPPPALLQGLACPGSLTRGATGLCDVTLTGTQLTDTVVPLAASDPTIVAIAPSVIVPANTLSAQFVVTAVDLGSALITAGPLNGTTQSATAHVLPPPPFIASFQPPTGSLYVGATATLTLTLSAAQLTDTWVPLAVTPSGIITVATGVTVPAGMLSAAITVTGLAPGTASLTVGPLSGGSAQSLLTVNQLPPTVTVLSPSMLGLPKGRLGVLTLTIAPTQPEATVVSLSSSDSTTVEVPPTVTVPAGASSVPIPLLTRNVGTASIIAGPLNGSSQNSSITVTPPELVSLVITPPAPSIAKGQTQIFVLMGTFTDGTSQDLTWTATWASSDEAVATVGSGGVAVGHAVGQATLTAAVGSVSTTAALTVTPPVLTSIALNPESPTRVAGEVIQFRALGTLSDGTTQDLTDKVIWTTTDPAVAAITSQGGLVTTLTAGQTSITAKHSEGVLGSTILTVILPPPTITKFDPASGKVGMAVTITGNFLGSTNRVSFNGMAASFTILSATQVRVIVPAGATSGPLALGTPGGSTTTSGHFLVLPTPDLAITLEPNPVTAVAGTSVSLKVSTNALGSFAGLTTLSAGTLPMGVTVGFSNTMLGPNASGIITLTTSESTPSPATIEVRGSAVVEGAVVTRSATTTLAVQPPGQTVLAGQVRDEDDKPLAGVSIKRGGSTISSLGATDAAGNFLVTLPAAGPQVFLIDGSTASTGSVSYATIPVTVSIAAGTVNTLGFIPHLHGQPATQPLPVAPAAPTPVSFAELPDFLVTIPAGVRIIGWDGQANAQIGVRPVPVDRLAVPPLPAGVGSNVVYMFSFGKVGGGVPTAPVPVTLPNTTGAYPGQSVELWYFNEAPDGTAPNAWQLFGSGTVSSDGRLIVSNPGVGIPRFCCGAITPRPPANLPPAETVPQPSPEGCPTCGGPIDLASGIVRVDATDLRIAGRIPLVVRRTYRTLDPTLGPFGIGWRHAYEVFVQPVGPDMVVLITPENLRPRFAKQANGTYLNTDMPRFRGARLTKNADNTWSLRIKDGTFWTFNAAGWLVGQVDRTGNRVLIQRDSQNRVGGIFDGTGRGLTFTYGGTDLKVQQVTDPLGRTVQYSYDASNRLIRVIDPGGGTWQYTYDAQSRLETITDPRGTVTERNTYDSNGRAVRQVQADGGVFQIAYQVTAGTVTQVTETDPSGNTLTYRFNGGRFLIDSTDPLGQSAKTTRAPGTQLVTSRTDALARTTRYAYDTNGNVISITDALGNLRSFTYDPLFNQPLTSTDPLNQTTSFAYDAAGNLLGTTDPLGHTMSFTYNAAGQPVTISDALSHTTTLEYDSVGNLTRVVDPLGNRTERIYDEVSRLIAFQDPRGAVTRFTYDAMDRLLSSTDPLNGVTRFTYDPNGNLLTVTDAKNQTTTHTYDSMNRLVTRTDPLTRIERFTYDANGNLKTVTDRKGQITTHTYDAQDRRIRTDYGDGSATTFSYDAVGMLLTATDSVTGTITRSYDALNRLISETTPQGTVVYTYDPLSRRQTLHPGGLPPVNYTYDTASRLTEVRQGEQAATLAYDAANRRTTLTLPIGISVAYDYDAASRLLVQTYTGPNGTLGDLTYTYDPAGNRIATGGSWARSLLPAEVLASSYDPANEQVVFGPVSQTFDPNGNRLTQTGPSGTNNYTWDARNRLREMSGPSITASFAYDAVGRRIGKTINGVTTTFLYDGLDILRESGGGGDVAYLRTLAIDEALSRTDGTGAVTYLADALGSTVALADSTGGLPTTYTYAPFGETAVAGATTNPVQFTGRENDGTGLYYYRARYYDPVRSRFVSEDSLGLESGVNFYAYAYDAPVRWTDPSGLTVLECRRPLDTSLAKGAEHTLLYSTESERGFGFGPANGAKGFLSAYPGVRFKGKIEWERPVANGLRPQPLVPGYSCQVVSTHQCVEACANRMAEEASKNPPYYKLGHYQCDTWASDVVTKCKRECQAQ